MRNRRNRTQFEIEDFNRLLKDTFPASKTRKLPDVMEQEDNDLELTYCQESSLPDDVNSEGKKRRKKDILLLDKHVDRRVRQDLTAMYFNRRDIGFSANEWSKDHNWKLLECHPIYGMKNMPQTPA